MTDEQPTKAQLWMRAVRPFSFTASAIPVLVGALAGYLAEGSAAWLLLLPVLVAGVVVHAGTNLFNDTHDFQRGVDREGTLGGSGLLVEGSLTARQTGRAALMCFILVAALGAWFIVLRGWPIAVIGLVGLLGGYAYTGRPVGYKYVALGDPLVFVLMGPLMVIGADLVMTGVFHWTTVWISLPVGFLVMSILHGNNLRDMEDDRTSGFKTVAMILGNRNARVWYAAMVLMAFVVAAVLIGIGVLPLWSAAVVLALPMAMKNVMRVLRSAAEDRLADIDVQSAQVHAQFGVLLSVSLVIGSFVGG